MAEHTHIAGLFTKERTSQKGMTLVELSVSVTIIGIMLAGILGGMNVLKASNLRRVASEFTTYKQAVDTFITQYGYYPGDIPTAYNFWGATCGANTSGAAGSCNGDGNSTVTEIPGDVSLPYEDLLAWKHLALAGLVGGSFTGTNFDASTRYKIDVNAPSSSAYTDGVYSFALQGSIVVYNTSGHTFRFGTIVGGNPLYGVMTAKEAYSIDKKIDDGLASYGNFFSTRVTTGCTDADWNAASANYNLASTVRDCSLFYWYKKN